MQTTSSTFQGGLAKLQKTRSTLEEKWPMTCGNENRFEEEKKDDARLHLSRLQTEEITALGV